MLGLSSCGAFDLNAACSGWVYALVNAHGLIAMGANKVLVIGTDTLDRVTDYSDRNTAILFGNGSGAAVVEAVDGPGQMLAWDLNSLGEAEDLLYAELGGFIKMEGREVFRRAVRLMADAATNAMTSAGVTCDDIALVVPHQANVRIISASLERLDIPMERASLVLDRTGNTSSASVPLAPRRSPRPGPRHRRRPDPVRRLRRRDVGSERRDPLEPAHPVYVGARPMSDGAPAGRIVLVTGGSRGIGLACARRLSEAGRSRRRHVPLVAPARRVVRRPSAM